MCRGCGERLRPGGATGCAVLFYGLSWLVPTGDADAVAHALPALVENDDLRQRMGGAALTAPARFDPARFDPARIDPARIDPARIDPARIAERH
jgi:glycosyltransferase involved in cell wall biosynthesis